VDTTESLAAIRSKNLLAAEPTNIESIIAILDCRRRSKEGITKIYQHNSLNVKEIIELLDLHKVATFFLEDYSASLPPPSWWSDDVMGSGRQQTYHSASQRTSEHDSLEHLTVYRHGATYLENQNIIPWDQDTEMGFLGTIGLPILFLRGTSGVCCWNDATLGGGRNRLSMAVSLTEIYPSIGGDYKRAHPEIQA
jgi:hypothetical protein